VRADQPIQTSLVEDVKFIGVDFTLNVEEGVATNG
jgi:hypothetical protein